MKNLPQLTPEQAEAHRQATRLRPMDAWRAMRLGIRNPDDTEQAVRPGSEQLTRAVAESYFKLLAQKDD